MVKEIAYFDCPAGASGDMLLASVLDVLASRSPGTEKERAEKTSGAINRAALEPWFRQIDSFLKLEHDAKVELKRVFRSSVQALKVDFFVGDVHADHLTSSTPHGHHHAHEHSHHHEHEHGDHHAHPHEHRAYRDIVRLLEEHAAAGSFSREACALSKKIFEILAHAEAKVHGSNVGNV